MVHRLQLRAMFNSNIWAEYDKYLGAVEKELQHQLVNRPIDMATPYVDQFIKGKLQLVLAMRAVPGEVEATILAELAKEEEEGKAGQ